MKMLGKFLKVISTALPKIGQLDNRNPNKSLKTFIIN